LRASLGQLNWTREGQEGQERVTSDKSNTGRAWAHECALMARGVLALLRKSADVQPLIDADHALDLSRNTQLVAASPENQERHRREYATTLVERLRLLRRDVFWSFIILASAVALSLLFSYLVPALSPSWRAWLGASSIFSFAWATLAKLGWPGQSWSGDTVVERLDEAFSSFSIGLGPSSAYSPSSERAPGCFLRWLNRSKKF
jgi:hypothetical protein